MLEIQPGQTPVEYYDQIRDLGATDSVSKIAYLMIDSVDKASYFMRGFGQSLRGDRYSDEKLIEEGVLVDNVLTIILRNKMDQDNLDKLELWNQAYNELQAGQTGTE